MNIKKSTGRYLKAIVFFCFFFCEEKVIGQAYKEYVPPTPTAAALAKYVDQPVNLSTGTPEINIPLYEIKCGSLTLPISLNYHAGGFKVEEEASWVGLGWSLMAGGVVTRTIRHLKDNGGFRNSFFDTYDGSMLDGETSYGSYYLSKLSTNVFDGSPDLYSYNFNGNSGKFVNINGVKLLPKKPLTVVMGGQDAFITIIDEKGNTYIFSDKEISQSKAATSYEVSSWYLSKIISPAQDTISFEYKDTKFIQNVNLSESKTYVYNTYRFEDQNIEEYSTIINGKELSKIKFNQGEVHFMSSYNRADLKSLNYQGGLRLDSILVFDKLGNKVKGYQLDYNYFLSSPIASSSFEKRLKLTSLREFLQPQSHNPSDIKLHVFTYNETINLPNKQSFSQDHWGYYNAKNNQSLVPDLIPNVANGPTCASSNDILQPNREPDTAACKANILTQINYPTGGYTRFQYESHDYGYIKTEALPLEIKESNVQNFTQMASAYFMHTSYGGSTVSTDIKYFSIAQEQCVKIEVNIQEGSFITPHGQPMAYLFRENEGNDIEIAQYSKFESGTYYLTLEPGDYYLKAISAMSQENIATIQLAYKTFVPVPSRIKYAGGVRVKRVVQHSRIGPDIIKSYDYKWHGTGWNSNEIFSSGVLIAKPEYDYISYKYFHDKVNSGTEDSYHVIPCSEREHIYIVISSNSWNILNSGVHIGYREVTEFNGLNQDQGKSVYNFSTTVEYPTWPGRGGAENSWQRGLLLARRDYKSDNKLLKKKC